MTATTALLIVVLVWLLIGALASLVMARRGHDPVSWGLLGALWGPLVIPAAWSSRRRAASTPATARREHTGTPGPGPVNTLVGVDGSRDSEIAACKAVRLLGDQLGRITLATVLDYDTAEASTTAAGGAMRVARDVLARAADEIADADAETVVLTGHPAPALLEFARANHVDLVVVGARGRGVTHAVMGHVSSRLVRQQDVPVLLAGAPPWRPLRTEASARPSTDGFGWVYMRRFGIARTESTSARGRRRRRR